ncbi:MAG TPA: prepilin peptidase, partial [Hydrogenophaga sp.]
VIGLGIKAFGSLREGGYVPFGPFLAISGATTMMAGPAFFLHLIGL